LRVHQLLQARPIVSIPGAARALGLTAPTVATALGHLQRLGLVRELTQRRRHRLFTYEQYLTLLNQGTELV
jgi:Fic family protein